MSDEGAGARGRVAEERREFSRIFRDGRNDECRWDAEEQDLTMALT